jgi:hypothetical protein
MPYRDRPPVSVHPTVRPRPTYELVFELLAWMVHRNGEAPTLMRQRAQREAREWIEAVERWERSRQNAR